MPQATSYKVLSQTDEAESQHRSLYETSDELTSSSLDSLDQVLLEIGNKKKKRRKRRRKMSGLQKFDGAESYEVSDLLIVVSKLETGFRAILERAT